MDRIKQWIQGQGIAITREYIMTPTGTASMQADEDLVASVRHHENVDYLEPVTVGVYHGETAETSSPTLVAVVMTSPNQANALRVGAGDEVTATFHQPDGSILTATAVVRQ